MWALLPSAWWWRIGIGLALAALGAYEMHRFDSMRYDALQAEYTTFKVQTEANGKLAEAAAKVQEAKQNEAENALRAKLATAGSDYAALAKRLRNSNPVRPDGSAVPVASCHAKGSGGQAAAESVSLDEYRALQERAAYDAQTITLYQAWVDQMEKAGAIQVK